ncbi:3-hydroxyacyl-CoA dehydrogenase family protein [Alkaliphilus transvaalensis]|uniref:3-hydroxyacyl-CoA dehydrogenase family protein n=1 Tax=Alkaliphilus transvaalensis TaxID=114628 RepID=UPI00047CF46D|nr:3-hydroxyacyl-CoA dehydrogenase family protein [Alkaliphilus transvaalensis]
MKIGIIGKGRMGIDMFLYLLNYNCELVLICRKEDDVKVINADVEKILLKKKKRGLLSEEDYKIHRQLFTVSTKYEELRNCNLVIETVIEDLAVKQELIAKVEEIVSDECIISSNTSSLNLELVFKNCRLKHRCMGLHFFYPIKCTSFVEISLTKDTDRAYVNQVVDLMKNVDKESLVVQDEGCLVMTKIINTIVSYSYLIYQEGYLSIKQLDSLIKNEVMMFGPFEIVDSTGLYIILACLKNFDLKSRRYDNLYENFYSKLLKVYEKGYIGGATGKGLVFFESEEAQDRNNLNNLSESELDIYQAKCVKRLQSMLLNEVAYLLNSKIVKDIKLPLVIQEILGLRKSLVEMYNDMGKGTIEKTLADDFITYNMELFKKEDFSIFEDLINN